MKAMETPRTGQLPENVPADRVVNFDLYNPPEVEKGFHASWVTLHKPGTPDIVWTPQNEGHWIVTRGSLINQIFADYENYSSRIIIVPKSVGEQHTMIPSTIDPPAHRPFRNLLNGNLSPGNVRKMEEDIRELSASLVEGIVASGSCDFVHAYAEILPVTVFLKMLDLPVADAPELKLYARQIVRPDGSMTYEEAFGKLSEYLEPYIDYRTGKEGGDMLSRLVNGRLGDRMISRPESIELCVQILIAGLDTVINFLGFVMLFLACSPEHRRQLAENPALISDAVEELLRRFPIVTMAREVTRDLEVDGVLFKKGDVVVLPTALHGLDARENEQPFDTNFSRRHIAHSTFGNGPHKCPGAHLARAEIRITLEEWLKRIPEFELTDKAVIKFTGGIAGVVNAVPLKWSGMSPAA